MECYLDSCDKSDCFGCGACQNACPVRAISMQPDEEGFRYPKINAALCIECNLCRKVCVASSSERFFNPGNGEFFGGYVNDENLRRSSSSGGAFSAIADVFCMGDYAIFGAEFAPDFSVRQSYVTDKSHSCKFRGSKYEQSDVSLSFIDAKKFLQDGKRVLFSGTPCQIAGLKNFLGRDFENLLTVDVLCESVPSPLFVRKYMAYLRSINGSRLKNFAYRDKFNGGWECYLMSAVFEDGKRISVSRWFNLFYSAWFAGLMSRPACQKCRFCRRERVGDISLGDLWRIFKFPRKIYGGGLGTSLIIANSPKGCSVCAQLGKSMRICRVDEKLVVCIQRPLRQNMAHSEKRGEFMSDLQTLDYRSLRAKWLKRPPLRLLFSAYVLGDTLKRAIYNAINFIKK